MINTNARPEEISEWKRRREVEECYRNLFKKVNPNKDDSPLMLTHIVNKIFPKKDYSDAELAYVMAICSTVLNPKSNEIMCRKDTTKKRVKKYLVSF